MPWQIRGGKPDFFKNNDFTLDMRSRIITSPAGQTEPFEPGHVVEFDPDITGGPTMAPPNPTEPRTKRIEARIAPSVLAIVKRAADLRGSSVSDFVVDAAREKALRVLQEDSLVRLLLEEQERFVALLLDPPKPNAAMKRAAAAHAKLVRR